MTNHNRDEQSNGVSILTLDRGRALERIEEIVGACHIRLGRPLQETELEEAVQETAIAVWRRGSSFGGKASEAAWVYGVARLAVLDRVRRCARTQASDDRFARAADAEESARMPTPVDSAFGASVRRLLRSAGTTEAEILRARLVDQMSFRAIGAEVRLSATAAKARFHRALPLARRVLRSLWDVLEPRRGR